MPQPIRRRVLLAVAALIALGVSATIFAVLRSAHSNIEVDTQRELTVAARLFDRLLAERNEQLASHATLLARDFRFKQAIATHAISRNDADMVELLAQHQRSIGADLSLLVDSQGRVTSNAPSEVITASTLDQLQTHESNRLNVLTVIRDKPYQLVFAPVRSANWIAWVGMGFELEAELVRALKNVSSVEASLLFQREHGPIGLLSTLPEPLTDLLATTGNHLPSSTTTFMRALEQRQWLSSRYPLIEMPEAKLVLVLSASVRDELADYQSLRAQLLTLGILVFFLATAVAFWFSGRSNYSISSVALAAQRIARGDYSKNIALADDHQLATLESAFNEMQQAIEERENRISFQAQHDLLTGLPNRHSFDNWIKAKLAAEAPEPCAMILMQICGLNHLTDIYGPDITNRLVKSTAERAEALLGPRDKIARFDSDQFFIYREGVTETELAELHKQMVDAFQAPLALDDAEVRMEVRMGAVLCPEHGKDYADLLRRSNIALSQTFTNKTYFEVYQSGQDASHLRKLQIIHCLQDAVEQGQFELLFQPQCSIAQQTITRAEVLLRWHDENLGVIRPEEFISLAERSGHIVSITRWLLEQVLDRLAEWRERGIAVGISINISAQDLLKDAFVEQLMEGINEREIEKSRLVLEVTEGAMIEHPNQAIANLRRLHDFGIAIAMDDFGTGFSSLSQLKSLPINELKIDKSFILNLDKDRDDQKIVHAAIDMAHNLDLQVVAEGVENLSTLTILESMGCDIIQGNYLGTPMSAADFESWLENVDPRSLSIGGHAQSSG